MANTYDVAIIGAGPCGCVAALAFAEKHKRVLLLEANPQASERLAGEWLHPTAYQILRDLGVDVAPEVPYESGRGFAVFPDDGTAPIVLPYEAGVYGFAVEHSRLVERLRACCEASDLIEYLPYAKATRINGQHLTYQTRAAKTFTIRVELIIGASGKASIGHDSLGIEREVVSYSRMAGILLEDARMPFEGFGHVFLGGPGPVLAYRIAHDRIRLCLDVPISIPVNRNKQAVLWEGFRTVMPEELRPAFRRALEKGSIAWAANQIRPRIEFGREGLALIGDAVGHHHPLTAVGMTLGFRDAVTLADAKSFSAYRRDRLLKSRVPEMLAIALYEVFADPSDETVEIRRAIFEMWRRNPAERMRTMGFLAGQNSNGLAFGWSFLSAVGNCAQNLVQEGFRTGHWDHVKDVTGELGDRIRWLVTGALHLANPEPTKDVAKSVQEYYGSALRVSMPKAEVVDHPSLFEAASRKQQRDPLEALRRGTEALGAHQGDDGSWEGEVVWCPMLAAQYAIVCHLLDIPLDEGRRRRILKQFAKTRLPGGAWGMHEWLSEPYLFVTALVYVAARLLGVAPDDPLIRDAGRFICREGGVAQIPSWGKFWLAMLNLYDWSGANPVLPEAWLLPKWSPLHPSRYYCHTRMIYLGMATIYASKFQTHCTSLIRALRKELYPEGYENVDFKKARTQLRAQEIFTPPSAPLKVAYQAMKAFEKLPRLKSRTKAVLDEMREHIRYELKTSSHTSISPVSGLLNIVALWLSDPEDPDVKLALERFEGWIWEDEVDGLRVTGARSATWDTGFVVQALVAARPYADVDRMLQRADRFLAQNQIKNSFGDESLHYRLDPKGGFCFAGGWHGWPVSDCTAEALLARLESPQSTASKEDLVSAARFILQCQNGDGGFGSYEARRVQFSLEWLNPAEMFGDSMTEHSYVECTASCVAALAEFRERFPTVLTAELDRAIARGGERIRTLQNPDGSWEGNWGVNFIYGTMFGVRGLLAAGSPPQDPAIRRACGYLLARQRDDGGWSERKDLTRREYVEGKESQVVQTAWALSTLIEAADPTWDAVERAAGYLAEMQLENGEWPKQDPAGIFFHTALLDYVLYKSYFPIWALAQYEARRAARADLVDAPARTAAG